MHGAPVVLGKEERVKASIKFAGLFFLFCCTFLVIANMQTQLHRQEDMEDALSISMRNSVKAAAYTPLYAMTPQDMQVELIRNLAENLHSDGTIDVIVYEAQSEGLLDVGLRNHFTHNNGVWDTREVRKTLLLEQSAF